MMSGLLGPTYSLLGARGERAAGQRLKAHAQLPHARLLRPVKALESAPQEGDGVDGAVHLINAAAEVNVCAAVLPKSGKHVRA